MTNNKKGGSSYQTSYGFTDTVSILTTEEEKAPEINKTDSFNIPEKTEKKNTRQQQSAKPPVAKPAVAKQPVAKPTVAKQPVAKPAVAKPAVAKPAVEKPAVAKQPVAKPAVAKPQTSKTSPKDEVILKNGQNLNQVVHKLYNRFAEGGLSSSKRTPVVAQSEEDEEKLDSVETSEYVDSVETSEYVDSVETSEYVDSVETSEHADSVETPKHIDAVATSKHVDLIDENILIDKLAEKLKPHLKEVIYQKTTQAVKAQSKGFLLALNQELEKELPNTIDQILDEHLAKIIKEYL